MTPQQSKIAVRLAVAKCGHAVHIHNPDALTAWEQRVIANALETRECQSCYRAFIGDETFERNRSRFRATLEQRTVQRISDPILDAIHEMIYGDDGEEHTP